MGYWHFCPLKPTRPPCPGQKLQISIPRPKRCIFRLQLFILLVLHACPKVHFQMLNAFHTPKILSLSHPTKQMSSSLWNHNSSLVWSISMPVKIIKLFFLIPQSWLLTVCVCVSLSRFAGCLCVSILFKPCTPGSHCPPYNRVNDRAQHVNNGNPPSFNPSGSLALRHSITPLIFPSLLFLPPTPLHSVHHCITCPHLLLSGSSHPSSPSSFLPLFLLTPSLHLSFAP